MIPPLTQYDVTYIGAGPFGITAACLLKGIDKTRRIVVLDKGPEPTGNYGLHTDYDSVNYLLKKIDQVLEENWESMDREALLDLRGQFELWKGKFIRTIDIEDILAAKARKMGIQVLRHEKFEITEKNAKNLLDPEKPEYHSELGQYLRSEVIVDAEGAKSPIRHAFLNNEMTESQTLQYLIELKYQTDGHAVPRNYKMASSMSAECGNIAFESMNKNPIDKDKPVTLHSFVSKELFDSLRIRDANGNLKGTAANPWTIKELEERQKNDPYVRQVYLQVKKYLKDISKTQGRCKEAAVSGLDLTIFCSKHAYIEINGQHILLGGDAFSGMVLERGWNKAIMEAVNNAFAIRSYFKNKSQGKQTDPHPFKVYENELKAIYANERSWALLKNSGINVMNWFARLVSDWVFKPINIVHEARALIEYKATKVAQDFVDTSYYVSKKVSHLS